MCCRTSSIPWPPDLMHGIKRVFDPRGLANPGKALPEGPGSAVAPPAPTSPVFDWENLTVALPVDAAWGEVVAAAAAHGFRPDGPDVSAGAHVPDLAAAGALRDGVLEVWAVVGGGRHLHAGRPVAKNVAGYDLPRLLAGADAPGELQALTLPLRPVSLAAAVAPPALPTAWPAPEAYRRAIVALCDGEAPA